MSRSIKNSILLALLVVYVVLYKLIIFNNFMKYSGLITASFLVVLLGISVKFLGFRKSKPTVMSNNILKNVIFYLIVTFILMYALGSVVGFLTNAYSRSFLVMIDNIFAPILIIIFIEFFRYVFISANNDKKVFIVLLTIVLIIFEVSTSIRVINFDFDEFFKSFALIIIPSIIKNIVLSYLCFYIGYKVPIIYRLVMDVYGFIIPILPNLGDYITSVILITLPIVIYISSFGEIDRKIHKPDPVFGGNSFTIKDIPLIAFLVILIALVSGVFPLFMIGVGSQSMSPRISKGDAVILRKLPKYAALKKNDIIGYKKDGITVVHRIVDIERNKKEISYVTKGDANNSNDSQKVKRDQIVGIVEFKIPYIAYPTIWLRELVSKQ